MNFENYENAVKSATKDLQMDKGTIKDTNKLIDHFYEVQSEYTKVMFHHSKIMSALATDLYELVEAYEQDGITELWTYINLYSDINYEDIPVVCMVFVDEPKQLEHHYQRVIQLKTDNVKGCLKKQEAFFNAMVDDVEKAETVIQKTIRLQKC